MKKKLGETITIYTHTHHTSLFSIIAADEEAAILYNTTHTHPLVHK